MVKAIKINDSKYQVSDTDIYFGRNAKGSWEVYDAKRNSVVARYLDDYDWAECVAFEYFCKVA